MQAIVSNSVAHHALQSFEQIKQLYPLNDDKCVEMIENGLAFAMLDDFMEVAALDITEVCFILGTDGNEFRLWRDEGVLPQEPTRKVLYLAEIYSFGYNLFGQKKSFNNWMKVPVRQFGMIPPLSLLCEEDGFQGVLRGLLRLEGFML